MNNCSTFYFIIDNCRLNIRFFHYLPIHHRHHSPRDSDRQQARGVTKGAPKRDRVLPARAERGPRSPNDEPGDKPSHHLGQRGYPERAVKERARRSRQAKGGSPAIKIRMIGPIA